MEKKLQKFVVNMGQRYKIFRKKEKYQAYYNEIREKNINLPEIN